jgi:ectoine hydroxylase-related dioxygenase (phytanoyl-CoA dioxygenase family)
LDQAQITVVSEDSYRMTTLPPETIATFHSDGVVVLRGLFADWIDPLRDGAAANLAQPGPYHRNYTSGAARFFGDYCNWRSIAPFRDFIEHSPAAEVARQLMQARSARIFHEHLLVKEAGADIPTPWHHDAPYYCVTGQQTVSLWLPLDPVPRAICLESVAGSHAWGKLFRPRRFDGTTYDHNTDDLTDMPDISGERDQYRIMAWDLAPGDAIAFNFMTVHGAPGNTTAGGRRAFSTRWMGEDVVYADRGGVTSPPFPHLAHLRHGDPLPADEFPVIAGQA